MTQLDMDKSDKKRDRATSRVEYTWSLKTVGLVEKTTTEQKWEEQNGEWVMVSETRIKGAPLTLFDEPAKRTSTSDSRLLGREPTPPRSRLSPSEARIISGAFTSAEMWRTTR